MKANFIDGFLKEITKDLGGPGSGNHGHAGRPGKVGGSAPDDVKIVDAKGIKKVGKAEKVGRFTGEFFILGNDVYYCELGHPYAAIALAEQKVISHRPNSDKVIEVVNQLDAVRVKFHYDDIILETREVNEQYLTQLQELMLDGIIEIDDSDRVQWGSANNKNILKTTTIDGFLGAQNIRELSLFKSVHLGGPGSGNHGHSGRPGQVGGSAPSTESKYDTEIEEFYPVINSYMFHVSWWEKASRDMSPKEREGIELYTDGYYKVVNRKLRGKTISPPFDTDEIRAKSQLTIEALDSFISKSKAEENFTVFRGIGLKDKEAFEKATTVGETFSDPAFFSTSISEKQARNFLDAWDGGGEDILFSIKVPKGQTIAPVVGSGGSETELLFPRNTKFKVVSVNRDTRSSLVSEDYWFVELELLDE